MNHRHAAQGESRPDSAPGEDVPFVASFLVRLRRQTGLILIVWLGSIAVAGIVATVQGTRYRAEATVEVRPEQPLIASESSDSGATGSLQLWDSYFRTQASLIQSRRLLNHVLKSLPPPVSEPYLSTSDPVQTLAEQLDVETIPMTFIIRVGLRHPSAERGPEIVNALVAAYLEEATGRWRELKTDAADVLSNETLPSIRGKVEDADRRLQEFQKETGFADFEEQYSSQLDGRRKLVSQLQEVRLRRVRLDSERESLAEMGEKGMGGLFDSSPQTIRAFEPILAQIAALDAAIASDILTYKEKHPRILALRVQADAARKQLHAVLDSALRSHDQERLAALIQERVLEKDLSETEEGMAASRSGLTRYKRLEAELASSRELYNAYIKKADDAKVTSKGGLASVRVIDLARSPAPTDGHFRILLTLGAVLGLIFGLSAGLIAEELDDRIRSVRDVEPSFGLEVLAQIPRIADNALLRRENPLRGKGIGRPELLPLLLADDPESLSGEVFRMLRGEVTKRLERVPAGRVIAVASPSFREGKTTVAINLARMLAMDEQRVLLIDGDLRQPRLKALLANRNGTGLEECLRGERDLRGSAQPSSLPGVDVLGAQQELGRPGEAAGSVRFRSMVRKARELYDYIIIDAGAVNLISEVSTLARQADGTILVLAAGISRRRDLRDADRRLSSLGAPVLGVVLNGVQDSLGRPRRKGAELTPELHEELLADRELVAVIEEDLFPPPSGRKPTNGHSVQGDHS